MRVEPLSRLAAEAELRKRHAKEFARLLKTKSEIAALVDLVSTHSKEYGALVTASRDRLRLVAAQANQESAA